MDNVKEKVLKYDFLNKLNFHYTFSNYIILTQLKWFSTFSKLLDYEGSCSPTTSAETSSTELGFNSSATEALGQTL